MTAPRFPKAKVKLSRTDGRPMSVMNAVRLAMIKQRATNEELEEFTKEATAGEDLTEVCKRWVTIV